MGTMPFRQQSLPKVLRAPATNFSLINRRFCRVAANLASAANLRANINSAQEKGRVAPALVLSSCATRSKRFVVAPVGIVTNLPEHAIDPAVELLSMGFAYGPAPRLKRGGRSKTLSPWRECGPRLRRLKSSRSSCRRGAPRRHPAPVSGAPSEPLKLKLWPSSVDHLARPSERGF